MKTKLIVVPGLIVISIILVIWFVYPALTNSADGSGLLENQASLKIEQEKLKSIDDKTDNARNLSFDIEKNFEKKNTLHEFIPESTKEEEIINNINYLISGEGLAVSGISVSQPKVETAKEEVIETPETKFNDLKNKSGSQEPIVTPIVKPKISSFETTVSVVGDYQKIKSLAEKINRLLRFNSPYSIKIKPAISVGNPENPAASGGDPNILQMDMVLEMNLLKKFDSSASPEDNIFSQKNFNMSLIDEIKEQRNIEKANIIIGEVGEANPFLP